MQEQAPAAKSPGAQLVQVLLLGHGPPPSLHRKAKLLNTSPKSCAQSSPCKVRMLKLLSVEGTDMLVLSKSKVQERGFFCFIHPSVQHPQKNALDAKFCGVRQCPGFSFTSSFQWITSSEASWRFIFEAQELSPFLALLAQTCHLSGR